MWTVVGLASVTMLAFAANSVLARLALASGAMDPLAYTGVRLVAGATVLALLLWAGASRTRDRTPNAARGERQSRFWRGSWLGAAALMGYALAFSLAYVRLQAGAGALILFATVQIGMLGWAIGRGERPSALEWAGMAAAFAGLLALLSPGLVAPSLVGAGLMMIAGLCWAAYTLIGRGSAAPLMDTAGNFIRCAPLGVLLLALGAASQPMSAAGMLYAIASGALASGLGYALWYTTLPRLTRTRAAIVQLTVPALAASGGAVLLGEPVTLRLLLASGCIIGGVALAVVAAEWRKTRLARAA